MVGRGRNRQPAVFLGHGSPMNALHTTRYSDAWAAFGRAALATSRPKAIVVVSAHWYLNATAATAMDQPRTIHDFFGFPPELFAVQYAAPGSAEVAALLTETAEPMWVGQDLDSWGFDHGAWSVLVHAFPAADIPVVQLSIDGSKPFAYHVELARRLRPLRDEGVLFLASGNIVHNLRTLDRNAAGQGFDWAVRFDRDLTEATLQGDADALVAAEHRDDFLLASPTPDHYLPLLYLAGLRVDGEPAEVLVDGYELGSLSMTSIRIG